jgi:hypothetical protein
MKKRKWISAIGMAGCFLLLALYGSAPLILPHPEPASIPADQFSAERAMQTVQALSQSPRRTGTVEMEQAVGYISNALRACGLEAQIQNVASKIGNLRNIIVRLPGTISGDAILIVSHLDSVSYGAGDNASGAAVLLETACTLKAGDRLRNDILLLFEDGEEQGYLGGYAFASTDAAMDTIRRVIGLDTAAWGPVVLLQTTPANAAFIQAYAHAVKNPTAFSFFADADWTISRDTSEIQPFYKRGLTGIELEDPTAFPGKHSATDVADQVKPGSLQQMGNQVLALVRSLGNSDLTGSSKTELSYFVLWGLGLVHYPAGWNSIFAILSMMILVGILASRLHQRIFPWRAFLASTGLLLLSLVGSLLVGIIGSELFGAIFPNPNPKTGSYLLPASLPFFLAVVILVLSAWLVLHGSLARRSGRPAVNLAGRLLWAILAILLAVLMPAGSTLLTLPLLATCLVGLLPAKLKWAGMIPPAMATILFAPNFVLAFLSTGMQTLMLVTLLAALCAEIWAEAWFQDFSRMSAATTTGKTAARAKNQI